jgi:hypothetical protein
MGTKMPEMGKHGKMMPEWVKKKTRLLILSELSMYTGEPERESPGPGEGNRLRRKAIFWLEIVYRSIVRSQGSH